jgi:hypothetical protein
MAGKNRSGRAAQDDRPTELVSLGLRVGDRVRFRRRANGHWHEATVEGREKDGSVAIRDTDGASRAITIDRLEVRTRGPRGAVVWEPLQERASRTEQLGLW